MAGITGLCWSMARYGVEKGLSAKDACFIIIVRKIIFYHYLKS